MLLFLFCFFLESRSLFFCLYIRSFSFFQRLLFSLMLLASLLVCGFNLAGTHQVTETSIKIWAIVGCNWETATSNHTLGLSVARVLTCTLCACSKKCTTTLHLLQAIFHFGPEVRSSTKTPLSHSTHCPMPKELSECWQDGWVHSLHPMPAER